jgi:hypothetical protein
VSLLFQYNSFDDLERDFIQMCHNAQKYNEEASLIHEDSIVLETVFANARVRLEQDSEPAEEEEEEEEEEEGEENPGWGKKISSYKCLITCMLQSFLTAHPTPYPTNFYLQKLGSDFMWNIKVLFCFVLFLLSQ